MITFQAYFVSIKIEKDYKNYLKKNDIIEIELMGNGIDKLYSYVVDTGGYYKEGDDLILFLQSPTKEENESYKKINNGHESPYSLMDTYQGQFWITDKNEILCKSVSTMQKYNLFKDIKTVDEFSHQMEILSNK
jgi:hypothetical protein